MKSLHWPPISTSLWSPPVDVMAHTSSGPFRRFCQLYRAITVLEKSTWRLCRNSGRQLDLLYFNCHISVVSVVPYTAVLTNCVPASFVKVKLRRIEPLMKFYMYFGATGCHLPYGITDHPTQVNTSCLNPSQRPVLDLPSLGDGRLVTCYRDGLPACRWSPIEVLTGPSVD